jgi:hypothetical protein
VTVGTIVDVDVGSGVSDEQAERSEATISNMNINQKIGRFRIEKFLLEYHANIAHGIITKFIKSSVRI